MRNLIKKVCTVQFLGLFFGLLLSSCQNFMDDGILDFIKEYTETAVIETSDFIDAFQLNGDGIRCFASDSNKSVNFLVRNPQNYGLVMKYEFNNSSAKSVAASVTGNSFLSLTLSGGRDYGSLVFPKAFLRAIDKLADKDISGKVTLYEPNSGRYFNDYSVSLHANSAPPVVQNACFQLSSAVDGTYIICFYLPNVTSSSLPDYEVHNGDTRKIYFNNELRYFTVGTIYEFADKNAAGNWSYSSADTRFTSTAPTMVQSESGFVFDTSAPAPAGYSTVYFNSGISQSPDTVSMEIKIEDDEGLSSSIIISNKAKLLSKPTVSLNNSGTDYVVNESTGTYPLVIGHNGMTAEITVTDGYGNSSIIPATSCGGNVLINYTITGPAGGTMFDGSNVLTGSGIAPVTLNLPAGTYSVSATASKNYYITSEANTDSSAVKIKPVSIYYVSAAGNDSNTGAKNVPLRTIQKAIDRFEYGVTTGVFDADTICKIRVMSDLTPAESDTFAATNKYALINFNDDRIYELSSYDGIQYTISAQGSAANGNRRIVYCSPRTTLTVNNLALNDGYLSSNTEKGAGLYYLNTSNSGAVIQLLFNNVRFKNNISAANGGAVYYSSSYKTNTLEFNNVVMEDNIATSGSAIYFDSGYVNSILNLNSCIIQNNHCINTGHGTISTGNSTSVSSDGTVNLKGNTVIQNNESETTGGAIYLFGTLVIDSPNVVIKNNNSKDGKNVHSVSNHGVIKINYPTTIYNNFNSTNNSQSNVYLDGILNGSTDQRIITVGGNLSGSKIGISTISTPSAGNPVTFTSGYNFGTTNTSYAGSIFISDFASYGVVSTGANEAALSVSGGNIIDVISSQTITFGCTATGFYPGVAKSISVTPTLTINGTAVTSTSDYWNSVTYETWLSNDGAFVTNTGSGTLSKKSLNSDIITIPATIPATVILEDEKYELNVKVIFNGVGYSESFRLNGKKDNAYLDAGS